MITTYVFTIKLHQQLPKGSLKGKIIVEFPTNYDIIGNYLGCDSSTAAFIAGMSSTKLTCSLSKNIVTITGTETSFNGDLTLNVRQIENPIQDGSISQIVVKTYDGYKQAILEKSFLNLDPFAFSFTFPGPLIIVNKNLPINIFIGTQSADLFLEVIFYFFIHIFKEKNLF